MRTDDKPPLRIDPREPDRRYVSGMRSAWAGATRPISAIAVLATQCERKPTNVGVVSGLTLYREFESSTLIGTPFVTRAVGSAAGGEH